MHYNSKFDQEQRDAVKLMHQGKSIFLCGEAGCGKTYCIDEYRFQNPGKNIIYLAPTGVAALAIGGMTIHRFFEFRDSIFDLFDNKTYSASKLEVLRRLDCIVIDEISMVSALMLDAIDKILRVARNSHQPFGQVQMILSGDLQQLGPIVPDDLESFFTKNYSGPYAFCARSWQVAQFQTVTLTSNYRQAEDKFYGKLLNYIRDSNTDTSEVLEYLNQHEAKCKAENKQPNPSAVNLCARNKDAAVINKQYLNNLPGKAKEYPAYLDGINLQEIVPADYMLELKVGAKVMFLANKLPDYANGSIGYVVELTDDRIMVKLENEKIVSIEPYTWYDKEYNWDGGKISMKIVGSMKQFPIKLAWATSIHKVQGMTLEAATIVPGDGMFAEGQLYVALSRVRSLADLRLDKPLEVYEASINPQVTAFYEGTLDQT